MLVLVTIGKICSTLSFARPLGASFLTLLVLGAPTSAPAQFEDGSSTKQSVSVLMSSDSQDSVAAEANEPATLTNSSKLSARPIDSPPAFPLEPQPPRELLVPQSPNLDSFTKPRVSSEGFANDLRDTDESSGVVTASFSSPVQSGSTAAGTLATTNQARQDNSFGNSRPEIVSSRPRPGVRQPASDTTARPRAAFTPPVVNNYGDSPNTNRVRPKAPSAASLTYSNPASANPASANPSFANSVSNNSATRSNVTSTSPTQPRASSWRDPETSAANRNPAGSAQSYPPGSMAANPSAAPRTAQAPVTRFNNRANSTYNQGVNPNIASGAPRISPRQISPRQRAEPNQNFNNQPIRQAQQSFNRDSSVRPTGFAQPTAPRKIQTALAKQLIARYSTDVINPQQLTGQPVKLLEMLNQPIATDQRRPMIHQFWDTYFDWASLVNSQQYLSLLESIPGSSGSADQALLEIAKMDAKNEVLASEIELVKSQSKLGQFMPNRPSTLPPPIPNDLPLIQKYNTQYERYKQFQMMPTNLLGIDKMLPKTLELIASRAETVQMAQSANQKVINGVRNGRSSVADALGAAKSWRAAEQNLLVAVMDYNHAICDYSLTVSRGYQSPQQVVGMLIAKPKANTTTNPPSNVAERFRNARSAIGNAQPSSNSARSQRLNGNGNFGSNNFGSSGSARPTQTTNSADLGQGRVRADAQVQQQANPPVEAGKATAFRSVSNNFGSSGSNSSNFNSNSNPAAAQKSAGFDSGSSNGFQPPPVLRPAQNNFAGQSQFKSPAAATRPPQPTQGPQNDPFGRTGSGSDRSANSQFKRPFGQ